MIYRSSLPMTVEEWNSRLSIAEGAIRYYRQRVYHELCAPRSFHPGSTVKEYMTHLSHYIWWTGEHDDLLGYRLRSCYHHLF